MRIVLSTLIAGALLCGCSGMGLAPRQNFSAPGACGVLARQRLEDARLMGLADGYERAIFDTAYKDCLARQATDPSPPR
jgi:hypothetical protein